MRARWSRKGDGEVGTARTPSHSARAGSPGFLSHLSRPPAGTRGHRGWRGSESEQCAPWATPGEGLDGALLSQGLPGCPSSSNSTRRPPARPPGSRR